MATYFLVDGIIFSKFLDSCNIACKVQEQVTNCSPVSSSAVQLNGRASCNLMDRYLSLAQGFAGSSPVMYVQVQILSRPNILYIQVIFLNQLRALMLLVASFNSLKPQIIQTCCKLLTFPQCLSSKVLWLFSSIGRTLTVCSLKVRGRMYGFRSCWVKSSCTENNLRNACFYQVPVNSLLNQMLVSVMQTPVNTHNSLTCTG